MKIHLDWKAVLFPIQLYLCCDSWRKDSLRSHAILHLQISILFCRSWNISMSCSSKGSSMIQFYHVLISSHRWKVDNIFGHLLWSQLVFDVQLVFLYRSHSIHRKLFQVILIRCPNHLHRLLHAFFIPVLEQELFWFIFKLVFQSYPNHLLQQVELSS